MHINKPEVLAALLAQEDTTGSKTITVEDKGPKHFTVRAANGDALEVRGTYHLANLLQEIWLGEGEIDPEKITLPPLERIDYLMRSHYWRTLTRRMDADNVLAVLFDEKRASDKGYLCARSRFRRPRILPPHQRGTPQYRNHPAARAAFIR